MGPLVPPPRLASGLGNEWRSCIAHSGRLLRMAGTPSEGTVGCGQCRGERAGVAGMLMGVGEGWLLGGGKLAHLNGWAGVTARVWSLYFSAPRRLA